MSEKIESAKWIDLNTKIQDKLKQLLKDDFEVVSQDDLSVLNSLDNKDKELLITLLNEKPEISKEILDNLPLDTLGLLKIIETLNKNKAILSKKENLSNLPITGNQEDKLRRVYKENSIVKDEEKQTINNEDKAKQEIFEETRRFKKEFKLDQNPNYQKYQNEAKQKLLASNPNLEKDKNFSDYVDSYILLQHQKEFLAWRPDLQASFETFAKNTSRLEIFKNIRIDEYIDRNLKDWTLKREKEQIKASLIPNWEDLQISWNEFRSWDQVSILDKDSWPRKFITNYWYKIDTSQELETPYKYQYDKDQIITNYNSKLKAYDSNQNTLKQLTQDIKDKEQEESSLDENAWFRRDIFKAELETFLKDFNKLTQDSKTQEQQIKELEKQAKELQSKEDRRIWDYRDNQEEKDEKAREILEFLHNIWFTNISQSDFEKIATTINSSPWKYGFSRNVNLNDFFEIRPWENPQRPYVEFINFFNKLLGLEWKDQINVWKVSDFVNWNDKWLTWSSFESKVKNTLYSEWSFRFTLIDERFSWKEEK